MTWQVVVTAEAVSAVVFTGDEVACRAIADKLVGTPIHVPTASGGTYPIGEVKSVRVERRRS